MELLGDLARKRGDGRQLAIEAAVTEQARALGIRSGAFVVPRVVRVSAGDGLLETERVHGFRTLMDLAAAGDPRMTTMCGRLGRAVAAVHASLDLAATDRHPFPASLADPSAPLRALHGDLTASNVGYVADGDALVVLDWSAAPAVGSAATIGTAYFDLVWFCQFLFRNRPLGALRGWRPAEWSAAFLLAYRAAGGEASASGLREYAHRIDDFLRADVRRELARRARGMRWLPYRAWRAIGWWQWERFLEEFSFGDGEVADAA